MELRQSGTLLLHRAGQSPRICPVMDDVDFADGNNE